jgi:hypothetical protein
LYLLIVASFAAVICASAPARAAATFTAKGIACVHAETIGRLTQLAADGDRTAFNIAAATAIIHGECIELSAGTVTLESSDESNYAICVRPSGEADCLWMTQETGKWSTP